MDKGTQAARTQLALERIESVLGEGLEIQPTNKPELKPLFRLEAIAAALENQVAGTPVEVAEKLDEVRQEAELETLAKVIGISGVGPALVKKIQKEFDVTFN